MIFEDENEHDDADNDDDGDDDQCDGDSDGGNGQHLPWESNFYTRYRPGADQVETRQRGAELGPTTCRVSTWSTLALHMVYKLDSHDGC